MKITNSRSIVILGGVLAATLIAGCWSGGRGYSNNPYGYNDNSYSSSQYGAGYGGAYTHGNGYNEGGSHTQYSNAKSYNAGYHAGVDADASSDRHENDVTVARVAVDHNDHQAQAEKEHSSVAHSNYSKDNSAASHESERN
jgi:hypothetical protein